MFVLSIKHDWLVSTPWNWIRLLRTPWVWWGVRATCYLKRARCDKALVSLFVAPILSAVEMRNLAIPWESNLTFGRLPVHATFILQFVLKDFNQAWSPKACDHWLTTDQPLQSALSPISPQPYENSILRVYSATSGGFIRISIRRTGGVSYFVHLSLPVVLRDYDLRLCFMAERCFISRGPGKAFPWGQERLYTPQGQERHTVRARKGNQLGPVKAFISQGQERRSF